MSKVVFRGDLKGLLEIRGMSQADFAHAAGLSHATVNRAVNGIEISHITFAKIIRALGAIRPIKRLARVMSQPNRSKAQSERIHKPVPYEHVGGLLRTLSQADRRPDSKGNK